MEDLFKKYILILNENICPNYLNFIIKNYRSVASNEVTQQQVSQQMTGYKKESLKMNWRKTAWAN